MMEESVPYPGNQKATQQGFVPSFNDPASMQIRVDTESVKQKIRFYLKGFYEDLEIDDNGQAQMTIKSLGRPKVNDRGLQGIMSFVECTVNPQTVQGNRSEEDFGKLMYNFRIGLARDLFVNEHAYGIDETEYDGICDAICVMVEMFVSRTINNKERESYGQSWQQRDSSTFAPAQKKRFIDYIPFIGGQAN